MADQVRPDAAGVADSALRAEAARLVTRAGRHELERRYGECWTCDAVRVLRMIAGSVEDHGRD